MYVFIYNTNLIPGLLRLAPCLSAPCPLPLWGGGAGRAGMAGRAGSAVWWCRQCGAEQVRAGAQEMIHSLLPVFLVCLAALCCSSLLFAPCHAPCSLPLAPPANRAGGRQV